MSYVTNLFVVSIYGVVGRVFGLVGFWFTCLCIFNAQWHADLPVKDTYPPRHYCLPVLGSSAYVEDIMYTTYTLVIMTMCIIVGKKTFLRSGSEFYLYD